MDLDPEQIESITLLKDAAATVIYGSEAANGVVVVETKKPIPGRLRVTYNNRTGIVWADFSGYNLASARQKLDIEYLAGYPYETPPGDNLTEMRDYYNALERDVQGGINTDWLRIPVRTVVTQRHGINFEGGDQALRYKIHLGANFAPGVMKGTDLTGQTGRIDLHYLRGKFQIVNQTLLDFSRGNRMSNYGDFSDYSLMNPYLTPWDEYGNIRRILDPQSLNIGGYGRGTPTLNPLYNTLYDLRNEFTELRMTESIRLEYRPINALRMDLDFTMTKGVGGTELFKPAQHNDYFSTIGPENRGSYSYTTSRNNSYRVSLTSSYHKLSDKVHLVSLFGRYTISERDLYNSTLRMTGFPNDKLSEIFMGTKYQNVSGAGSMSRALGLVFTGNYAYKQRYVADLSMRTDASSQFGRNNRYAPFWSAGVRWNGHNEDFVKQYTFFDEFIIRGSVGTTGSQDFQSWQALQTYSYNGHMTHYTGSDVVGTSLLALGNPNLKWQVTMNYNLGMDFTMFKGFFGARVEVYHKLTQNTLLDYTLAPSVGFNTIKENLGKISNKGYEFSARFMPWKNNAKRAFWNIVITGAHNKSTIEDIQDVLQARNEEIYSETDLTKPLPQYVNGASNTAIWGLKSAGIDPHTGEELFYTRDGTTTTEWDPRHRMIIGDRRATLAGSITSTFAYKNFNATLGSNYTMGGDIYNQTLADKVENANLRKNVDARVLTANRWQFPGQENAQFKALDGSESRERTRVTSRFIELNNELRLTSLSLTYRLGAEEYQFVKRLGMSSASFGVFFEDVLRLSTVQREYGIYFPFARTISLTLNVAF
jgi:TonB-linked SusC/RagA family outer membrane protein